MKKKYFLLFALALCSMTTWAQELWTSAGIDFAITKKLKADAEIECRTTDGLSNVSRWSIGAELSYRICKYLKADVAYNFLYQHNGNEYDDEDVYIPYYWQPRQRVQVGVTGSYKIGRLSLSLRECYQYTYHRERTTVASYNIMDNEWTFDKVVNTKHKGYLRSRIGAEYNIRKSRFTPYATCELYNNVSGFNLKKVRYTIGTEYKINRQNGVQIFYRFIDDRKDANTNVIGVGYTYKIK